MAPKADAVDTINVQVILETDSTRKPCNPSTGDSEVPLCS